MNLLISILIALGINVTTVPAITSSSSTTVVLDENFVRDHQADIDLANYIILEQKWHPDNTAPGGVVIDDDAHN